MPEATGEGEETAVSGSPRDQTPIPPTPKRPSPSTDPGVRPDRDALNEVPDLSVVPEEIDIDTLTPLAALKMLCDTINALVLLTGDVPPTPPITQPGTPNLGLIQAEKDNVARHLRERHHSRQGSASSRPGTSSGPQQHEDVPPRAKTPIGSPESGPSEPVYAIDSVIESSLNLQHGFIVRKFYSKKPPAISLEEYLMRVHQFCPMSTGVYLATSLYIHRLAVVERIIPVTARNAHRFVLAGLRVAMKKLEDQKYGHSRFSKVGGVSAAELGKLEVSFCFLTSFDLKANREMLTAHAKAMRDGTALVLPKLDFVPVLPVMKKKGGLAVGRTKPTETKVPAAAQGSLTV